MTDEEWTHMVKYYHEDGRLDEETPLERFNKYLKDKISTLPAEDRNSTER